MPLPDLPFYHQFKPMNTLNLHTNFAIQADHGYFRVRFVDMRLARDVVGATILAPVLHAIFNIKLPPTDLHEVLIGAKPFQDTKGKNLHRVYIAPQAITPIVPYKGNKIDTQLGLFSIPSRDLASEMLDLLGLLAGTAQRPDIVAAFGVANAVRRGINALLGLNGANLLLGWQGEIGNGEQVQQEYIVVTPSGTPLEKHRVSIFDRRLLYDSRPVDQISYIVFAIEVSNRRSDWRHLPEVKKYFDAWNDARSVYNLPAQKYNQAVTELLRALRTSPNIVPADAERIVRDEIQPLLVLGNDVQSSLFRAAGFNLDLLETSRSSLESEVDDFVELNVSGTDSA